MVGEEVAGLVTAEAWEDAVVCPGVEAGSLLAEEDSVSDEPVMGRRPSDTGTRPDSAGSPPEQPLRGISIRSRARPQAKKRFGIIWYFLSVA